MTLARHPHWATQPLHDFLLERAEAPFAWGVNDCALFAADAVLAITGVDIAAEFREKYSTEAEAFALIRDLTGGETVADAAAWCAERHGLAEWEFPLMAQRGDLAVIENDGRLIAGIVHLSGRHVVTVAESGLVRFDISEVKRAWHV